MPNFKPVFECEPRKGRAGYAKRRGRKELERKQNTISLRRMRQHALRRETVKELLADQIRERISGGFVYGSVYHRVIRGFHFRMRFCQLFRTQEIEDARRQAARRVARWYELAEEFEVANPNHRDEWRADTYEDADVSCVCCLAPILSGRHDDKGRCPSCAYIEEVSGDDVCFYN